MPSTTPIMHAKHSSSVLAVSRVQCLNPPGSRRNSYLPAPESSPEKPRICRHNLEKSGKEAAIRVGEVPGSNPGAPI